MFESLICHCTVEPRNERTNRSVPFSRDAKALRSGARNGDKRAKFAKHPTVQSTFDRKTLVPRPTTAHSRRKADDRTFVFFAVVLGTTTLGTAGRRTATTTRRTTATTTSVSASCSLLSTVPRPNDLRPARAVGFTEPAGAPWCQSTIVYPCRSRKRSAK